MSLNKYYEYFVNIYELYHIYNVCLKFDVINMTPTIPTNTTQEFVERVKSYPAVYDRQHPNHCKVKEKELIWTKLSTEFNCDAKRKWNALRDKYVREKKKERTSEKKFISNWDYFNCMNFLANHIKPRSQTENDEIYQLNENTDEIEEIDVKEFYGDFCKEMAELDDEENTNSVRQTDSLNDPGQKLDFDFDSKSIRNTILTTLETFREKLNNMNSLEEDEDKVFLELISNKMKKMSPIEKSNFQMEILKDADEFLYR